MRFIKRIFLFLVVNVAILLVLSAVMHIFGVRPYLTPYGLDLTSLLIFAAVIGFAGSFISLFLSRVTAKWMMKVRVIDQPKSDQEAFLVQAVGGIARSQAMPIPEIGIYPSGEVNAFATGWSRRHSLVAVSQGLLDQLERDEIEGVLAHEMAHISNGDMVTMTLLQGVLNTFVIFAARALAYAVQVAISRGSDRQGGISYGLYWITSLLFEIVFAILASMIVMWFSRRREFRADYGGAKFVGKSKMIAGLKRLQSLHDRVDPTHKSLATMKIQDRSAWARAFSSHPPLEERIEALQKAPIS